MRINGERWSAGSFTPAVMGTTTYASLTTDAEGTLYYLFSGRVEDGWKVGWRTSRNWSETLRVSRDDTFNPAATPSIKYDPYRNLVLAFWKEQRWEESGFVPFFASSANGWQPVRRRRHRRDRRRRSTHRHYRSGIDVFAETGNSIVRYSSATGESFTTSLVPSSDGAISVDAAADANGTISREPAERFSHLCAAIVHRLGARAHH